MTGHRSLASRSRALAVTACAGALLLSSSSVALAQPSPKQVRDTLLSPSEATKATGTSLLREKVTVCDGVNGCDRVLDYTLKYSKASGNQQPARFRIWNLGTSDLALRFVRVSALYPPPNTQAVMTSATVFTTWLPSKKGWGLSERVQAVGSWVVQSGCFGHTQAASVRCVDALGAAQVVKLQRTGLAAP